MFPFRSILCPVDLSEHSAHALRQAAALAGPAGATLTVVWVTDPLLAHAAAVTVLDPHGEQAQADLREFVTQTLPLGTPRFAEPRLAVAVGAADREILTIATQQCTDLIVMGTRGLSGFRKMLVGSTTERVLRRMTTPVWVVPIPASVPVVCADGPGLEGGPIVVAIDLGEGSQALAELGVGLADSLGARLLFVHVVPPGSTLARRRHGLEVPQRSALDDARRALSQLATNAGDGPFEIVVAIGSPVEEIAALATTRHAALVVMGLVRPTGIFGARPGSIAYGVLARAPTPVLVVPPHARQRVPLRPSEILSTGATTSRSASRR